MKQLACFCALEKKKTFLEPDVSRVVASRAQNLTSIPSLGPQPAASSQWRYQHDRCQTPAVTSHWWPNGLLTNGDRSKLKSRFEPAQIISVSILTCTEMMEFSWNMFKWVWKSYNVLQASRVWLGEMIPLQQNSTDFNQASRIQEEALLACGRRPGEASVRGCRNVAFVHSKTAIVRPRILIFISSTIHHVFFTSSTWSLSGKFCGATNRDLDVNQLKM